MSHEPIELVEIVEVGIVPAPDDDEPTHELAPRPEPVTVIGALGEAGENSRAASGEIEIDAVLDVVIAELAAVRFDDDELVITAADRASETLIDGATPEHIAAEQTVVDGLTVLPANDTLADLSGSFDPAQPLIDGLPEISQSAMACAPIDDEPPDAEVIELNPREPEISAEIETEDVTIAADVFEPPRRDPVSAPAWSGVNTLGYAFGRGLRGMGQSPLVQLLAVGTMAVCMLLLGTTTLIFQNARTAANDWGLDVPVTVYMQDEAAGETDELLARVAELPEVAAASRVTPEQALERLDEGLGSKADLLDGVDPELLPDSVEIQLIEGIDPSFAAALGARLETMEGVDEVAVLGPWVGQAKDMLSTLRNLALGVGLLVSLACLAIVWSTIRLGVFARRAEIQLLRLVGGTARFVRGPFVVEGVIQGLLGTTLALAGLWLGFGLIEPLLERGLSLMFAAGSIDFFTIPQMVVALVFGASLGILGSRAAVARYAEA